MEDPLDQYQLSYVRLDADQVRTLAHPLRLRLLGALRVDGPSTATRLAERLHSNTGKTSYHLRVLAGAGLVEEATELGDDRDRWWRSVHDVTRLDPQYYRDDPDAAAAADWLMGEVARVYAQGVEQWLRTRDEWPESWTRAAEMSDMRLRLTADGLRALSDELMAVVLRHVAAEAPADAPEAAPCTVIIQCFPNPRPEI